MNDMLVAASLAMLAAIAFTLSMVLKDERKSHVVMLGGLAFLSMSFAFVMVVIGVAVENLSDALS